MKPHRRRHPTLRRLRDAGHDPTPFRDRQAVRWVAWGGVSLLLLAALPFLPLGMAPGTVGEVTERLGTMASLVFLVAAVGLAVGLGRRSFIVGSVVVVVAYAASFVTSVAFTPDEFLPLAILVAFGLFALAGFNLVFILEEVVFDAHRVLHLRGRLWKAIMPIAAAALSIGLPLWHKAGGPWSLAVWIAATASTMLLWGWWFIRAVNDLPEEPVLQELHMFCLSILGATGLLELVALLDDAGHVVTSIVAYAVLLGTWLYVSYTTLQRTHFLLRGRNVLPWVCLLLSASFAIMVHAQQQFQSVGDASITKLLARRVGYLVLGVWVGIGFYVVQTLWAALRRLRETALGPRTRTMAGRAARVAETVLDTPEAVGHMVGTALHGIDRAIGWGFDPDGLRRLEEE